jgi:hypothetical protein
VSTVETTTAAASWTCVGSDTAFLASTTPCSTTWPTGATGTHRRGSLIGGAATTVGDGSPGSNHWGLAWLRTDVTSRMAATMAMTTKAASGPLRSVPTDACSPSKDQ